MNKKNKTSIALGFFDGIHPGHRAVIQNAVCHAGRHGGFPLTLTFTLDKDTRVIKDTKQIFDDDTRISLLRDVSGARVAAFPFSELFMLSPEEFVGKILVSKLNAGAVFCGTSFRFGNKAAGDVADLERLCKDEGIEVNVIPTVKLDGKIISSTLIRKHLSDGDIKTANRLLGFNYFIQGEIIRGNRFGNKIGIPTINQQFKPYQLVPKYGVYASKILIGTKEHGYSQEYTGATNIGIKPSVENPRTDNAPLCETHIINYSGDIYGKIARISLTEYIREEKTFSSHAELQRQIQHDIEKITGF